MEGEDGDLAVQLEGFIEVSPVLRSGVYVLIAKGEVIYVGKSKAMIARISTHRRAWIDKRQGRSAWITDTLNIPGLLFDEVHIRPAPLHLLDALEREMIDKYKPRYNKLLQTRGISAPITLNVNGAIVKINSPPPTPICRIERRV